MNKIAVEKNIKMPTNWERKSIRGTGRKAAFPLGQLLVGDGFKVPISKVNSIRCAIQHYQRWNVGSKFMTMRDKKKLLIKRIA